MFLGNSHQEFRASLFYRMIGVFHIPHEEFGGKPQQGKLAEYNVLYPKLSTENDSKTLT